MSASGKHSSLLHRCVKYTCKVFRKPSPEKNSQGYKAKNVTTNLFSSPIKKGFWK
jgi:hypothetical protein